MLNSEVVEKAAEALRGITDICFDHECSNCPLFDEEERKCKILSWIVTDYGEYGCKPWMWCVPDITEDDEDDEGIWIG